MRPRGRTAEAVLGRLATATHGVVRRGDLVAAGVTPAGIKARLSSGALLRASRRISRRASGAELEARYLVAVWACGETALLCGRAAYLLGPVVGGVAPRAEVVARGERRIEGVRVVRSRGLDGCDALVWRTSSSPGRS